jgi:hypothetical protein
MECDKFTQFFRQRNAMGFTQVLTEMSTRETRRMCLPVREANNPTAICEPII